MDALSSFKPTLAAFYTLQSPAPRPANPSSFPDANYYHASPLDLYLVVTFIAVMAILRDAFRLLVFEPFARWKLTRALNRKYKLASERARFVANGNGNGATTNGHVGKANGHANGSPKTNGHSSQSPPSPSAGRTRPTGKELRQLNWNVMRFAEQGWSVIYYTLSWCYGWYVYRHQPTHILNPVEIWIGYPHIPLASPVKVYYLLQTAFYVHQVLILNAEARRKDFAQMMAHHFITVALLVASYFTHFTRVGCVVLVLMDWCDIFLPLAKMIRYLSISQLLCDAIFAFFMVSWLVTRHVFFISVIVSTIWTAPQYLNFEWHPSRGSFITENGHRCFVALLLALQVMQCVWFSMICKVAWRVVSGNGAADNRSDDEDDDSKED